MPLLACAGPDAVDVCAWTYGCARLSEDWMLCNEVPTALGVSSGQVIV